MLPHPANPVILNPIREAPIATRSWLNRKNGPIPKPVDDPALEASYDKMFTGNPKTMIGWPT